MRTGLSETQGAGPLEAGKKCSAAGINKFCIIIKYSGRTIKHPHLAVDTLWHVFPSFFNFLTILISFWKLVAQVCIHPWEQTTSCLSETTVFDKQTVNNSFLVVFFTHACHVLLMKTIDYICMITFERHEFVYLFYCFPHKYKRAATVGDIISDRNNGFG